MKGLLGFLWGLLNTPATAPTPRRSSFSAADKRQIGQSANHLAEMINESLQIAEGSAEPATKLSRLGVAQTKLDALKEMAATYPFLALENLDATQALIDKLGRDFETQGLKAIADGNERGQQLESEGRTEEAIAVYEQLVSRRVDTPFPYKRLAILYRKKKAKNDELRVVQEALKNIPKSNTAHYLWFEQRLQKM